MPIAKDRRGFAAFELALMAPAIVAIVVGVSEMSMALRLKLRLDTTSQQIGQIVSQCNLVSTPGDEGQFWAEAGTLLKGATTLGKGGAAVIVSAVYKEGGGSKVAWQIRTGDTALASAVGAAGGTATLPPGFAPPGEHTVIVTEVIANAQPLILGKETVEKILGKETAEKILPAAHSATTLNVSRALDPVKLRQLSTDDANMRCTA